jgi:hypothetical protein
MESDKPALVCPANAGTGGVREAFLLVVVASTTPQADVMRVEMVIPNPGKADDPQLILPGLPVRRNGALELGLLRRGKNEEVVIPWLRQEFLDEMVYRQGDLFRVLRPAVFDRNVGPRGPDDNSSQARPRQS